MIGKNLRPPGPLRKDRSIWLLGACALALFAYLASGMVNTPGKTGENTTASPAPQHSARPQENANDPRQESAGKTPVKKSTWRSRREARTAPQGPGAGSIWRTLGGLGLVLVLVFAAAAFCSRFLKKMRMSPQGSKVLEMVDVISLGPRKQVFVLSVHGRQLVVGSTQDSMTVLSEFGPDEIEAVEAEQPIAFADKLAQNLKRMPETPAVLEVEA